MASNRRQFLRSLPFLASAARLRGADMIVRSARPEDIEMPLEGFATWITPVEKFFIRSHVYTPKVDAAAWQLRIEGEVSSALSLTLADLRAFPRAELVSVLECAGNGRSFYQPAVAGTQWKYGGVGNARWTGVRLLDILKKAGYKSGAREVLLNGADVPIGSMPDFVRALPLHKAVHPDTLLAYEMNGQPLTPAHGFPARVIAPGWAGDNWVKWLTNIEVRDKEFDGFFMKTAYRHPVRSVAPGAAVDAADMTPVTSIRPKSVIASPVQGQTLAEGVATTIRGAAWSGESPIRTVEVSTDSGRTWRPARLGPDHAPYAWRLWECDWNPESRGFYVLMARATDESGGTQPLVQDWNPSGYLWNVIPQVPVAVAASPLPAPDVSAAALPEFPAAAKSACIGCHSEDMISSQRLTRAQWEREVDKMTRWGAPVTSDNRAPILEFLLSHFGSRP